MEKYWPWFLVGGIGVVVFILYSKGQGTGQTQNPGATSSLMPTTSADVGGIISPTSNVGTPISNGGSLYPIVDPATGITYLYDPSNMSINPIMDPLVPAGTPVSLPAWSLLPTGYGQTITSSPGA